MQIVHTDDRFIIADCDSGKRQTRPLVRESAPYQQACNRLTEMKPVVLGEFSGSSRRDVNEVTGNNSRRRSWQKRQRIGLGAQTKPRSQLVTN
jgi:hypothetical protein